MRSRSSQASLLVAYAIGTGNARICNVTFCSFRGRDTLRPCRLRAASTGGLWLGTHGSWRASVHYPETCRSVVAPEFPCAGRPVAAPLGMQA